MTFYPETLFSSLAPLRVFAHTAAKTHRAQQAWMNSRNQTTIATAFTHRQHRFLHPRCLRREHKARYSCSSGAGSISLVRDPSLSLRISAAGSRFAHARKAPQLADSVLSL